MSACDDVRDVSMWWCACRRQQFKKKLMLSDIDFFLKIKKDKPSQSMDNLSSDYKIIFCHIFFFLTAEECLQWNREIFIISLCYVRHIQINRKDTQTYKHTQRKAQFIWYVKKKWVCNWIYLRVVRQVCRIQTVWRSERLFPGGDVRWVSLKLT